MRGGAGLWSAAAIAVLVASPAGAQIPVGGSLVCPPGLTAVATNNAFQPYRCDKSAPQQAAPPAAQAQEEKAPSDDRPAGDASVRRGGGGGACARFNAEFTPFYEQSEQEYAEAGEKQQDVSDRIRGLIADGQKLSRRLKSQAMGARSPGVRQVLLQQARSVDQDVASKQAMLTRLGKNGDKERAEWRKDYRARFQELLKKRPAGCRVEALAEEK